jgi:hypothetical protein
MYRMEKIDITFMGIWLVVELVLRGIRVSNELGEHKGLIHQFKPIQFSGCSPNNWITHVMYSM